MSAQTPKLSLSSLEPATRGFLGEHNRWLYVIIGFGISLILGLLYAWSIFVTPLERQFGWTRAQTSMAFTISIVFFVLGMVMGGRHSDKKGPRIVVSLGAVALAVGFFAASMAQNLSALYVSYGVLCGFGIGYANVVPMGVCMRWFPDRRGLISGILVMGFGLAAVILGSTAGYVINTAGYEWAFRMFGILSLVFCLVGAQFLKFPPVGWAPAGMVQPTATAPAVTFVDYTWRQMFATSTWWVWWVFHVVILTGGLMIIGHVVPLAMETGLSNPTAVAAMAVFSLCNGLGRLAVGLLWDTVGRNRTMIVAAMCMLVGQLILGILVAHLGFPALIAAIVLIAVAYGGAIPISSSLISANFGPKNFGVNYGLSTTPLLIAAILGPYLGGYIRTETGGYDAAIAVSAALAVLGIVMGIIVRDPRPIGDEP